MTHSTTLGSWWNFSQVLSCVCGWMLPRTLLFIFLLHCFNQPFPFLKLAKFHQHNAFIIIVRYGTAGWIRWFWRLARQHNNLMNDHIDKDDVYKHTFSKYMQKWVVICARNFFISPQPNPLVLAITCTTKTDKINVIARSWYVITLDSAAASPLMFLVEFEASKTVSVFTSVEDDTPSNQHIFRGLSGMPRSFPNASFCKRSQQGLKFHWHFGLKR